MPSERRTGTLSFLVSLVSVNTPGSKNEWPKAVWKRPADFG